MNFGSKDPCELAEIIYEKPLAGVFEEKLFGSDRGNTLWVKFSDKLGIEEWVGKFGTGCSGSNHIEKVIEPDQFLVSAGGFGYLVDASQRKLLDQHFDDNCQGIAYDPKSKRFIVAGYTNLRLVESNKTVWTSERFAVDGIWDFKVEGRMVRGVAITSYGGQETGFSFDMDTCKIKMEKPWWKFWW